MRILLGESNYDNIENMGNEIVLRKELGTTFVPESEEDGKKIKEFIEKVLGITNKEDD